MRIFDDDEDGNIYAADMVEVLTNLGDRLTKSEARKLVQNADSTGEGLINYEGDFSTGIVIDYLLIDNVALCSKLIPKEVQEKKPEKETKNQK